MKTKTTSIAGLVMVGMLALPAKGFSLSNESADRPAFTNIKPFIGNYQQMGGPSIAGKTSMFDFNREAAIWFPSESSDYNEAYKRAFLDVEAFVRGYSTDIGTYWDMDANGDIVATVFTIYVTGDGHDYMMSMIAWYNNLAATAPSISSDYRRGLEDGANTWTGMPLVWQAP